MKKPFITFFLFIGVSALVILGYLQLTKNQEIAAAEIYSPDPDPTVYVATYKVVEKPFSNTLTYLGTLAAYKELMLQSQLSGQAREVYFEEGDYVSQDKLLVRLDDDMLRSQYRAAIIAYENDSVAYNRFFSAAQSAPGSVSQDQLDKLFFKMRATQSSQERLTKQIALSHIRAPFDGYITKKSVEKGSFLSPAVSFARLSDLSKLKFIAKVSERDVSGFSVGQYVALFVHAKQEPYKSQIVYVSPRADKSHRYEIHALVKNKKKDKLKAGMYARMQKEATFSFGNSSALIPRAALLGSTLQPEVFLVKDGRVYLRPITLGRSNDVELEVVSGLSINDEVVVSGHINLVSGSKVRVNSQ